MASISRAIVASALLGASSAILVAENSPCAVSCGNVLDSTPISDIVCTAVDYSMTYQGTVFKSCVECESTSDYTIEKGDPATSDLQAMLCRSIWGNRIIKFGRG